MDIPQKHSPTVIALSNKYPLIHEWIYRRFARQAGLMKHEFQIYYDPNLKDGGNKQADIIKFAGECIHIFTRAHPWFPEFFSVMMTRVFDNRATLRELLRSGKRALVKNSDAVKWYSHSSLFAGLPQMKEKKQIGSYSTEVLTTVIVRDKETGREERVTIKGDCFTGEHLAVQLLYGRGFDE